MTATEEQIHAIAEAIADLYRRLLLSDIPEEPSYRGYLDLETPFALDHDGYHISYVGLLRSVFQLPNIGEKWSEDGIQEQGHQLLLSLAETKKQGGESPDFHSVAHEWLGKFDVEVREHLCYTAVSGLSVHLPLEVGDVTFLPLDTQRPELKNEMASSLLEKLNSYRDCLSCSSVTAEWRRASQIHRQKTEQALNVVRFIASLVWHDQPIRHIYIAGQDPGRVSDSLVVASEGTVSWVGASEFTPLPVQINHETIQYVEFYGLKEIQALLQVSHPSEIEQSFLTAIQWYGQATQEFLPLVAFVKYYISIEVVLKKEREYARSVLPRRLGVLIDPWDGSRLPKLEDDLRGFVDERNAVFHSGMPISSTPEELAWDARVLARQALHQLRRRLRSEHWQTKDDLIAWSAAQHQKYLS